MERGDAFKIWLVNSRGTPIFHADFSTQADAERCYDEMVRLFAADMFSARVKEIGLYDMVKGVQLKAAASK